MERTKTKLCGCGGTNIPVGGKIRVMCEFRDAKQKSEFYVVKTDSKRVVSLHTRRELWIIQILNEVTPKDYEKEKHEKRSRKELKQTILKMYPNLFKGLGKMEP